MVKIPPKPFKPREFLAKVFWKRDADGNFILATLSKTEDDTDISKLNFSSTNRKRLRGCTASLITVERLPYVGEVNQCRVSVYAYLSSPGYLPSEMKNNFLPRFLDFTFEIQVRSGRKKRCQWYNTLTPLSHHSAHLRKHLSPTRRMIQPSTVK